MRSCLRQSSRRFGLRAAVWGSACSPSYQGAGSLKGLFWAMDLNSRLDLNTTELMALDRESDKYSYCSNISPLSDPTT